MDPQAEITRLRRSVEELAMLNELAQALGQAGTHQEMVKRLIKRAVAILHADQGAVHLVSHLPEGESLLQSYVRERKPDATQGYSPDPYVIECLRATQQTLVINEPQKDERFRGVRWPEGIRSLLIAPMFVEGRMIGLLEVYDKHAPEGFTQDDARLLTILAFQSAQFIQHAKLTEDRESVVRAFGQHVAPSVVETILRRGSSLETEHLDVSVMFLDIRNFVGFAEARRPEFVIAYLNEVLSFMIDEVTKRSGMVHQLLGDGFLALFGVPGPNPEHARDAVAAGLSIVDELNRRIRDEHLLPTRLGIGIHSGKVVAGMIGTEVRKQYSVIGDAVNLASRIEQLNKHFGSTMLVSQAVLDRLDDPPVLLDDLGAVEIRGRTEPVRLFRLA